MSTHERLHTARLRSALSHDGPPRGPLFLVRPSEFGPLRLDCPGHDRGHLARQAGLPVPRPARQAAQRAYAAGMNGGSPAAAIAAIQQVLYWHPTDARLLTSLATLYSRAGDAAEALYHARQVVAVDQSPATLQWLAELSTELGRLDIALPVYEHLWANRHRPGTHAPLLTQQYLRALSLAGDRPLLSRIAQEAAREHPADPVVRQYVASVPPSTTNPHFAAVAAMDAVGVRGYLGKLAENGELPAAVEVAWHALTTMEPDWWLNFQIALAFKHAQRPAEALAVLDAGFDIPGVQDYALVAFLHLRDEVDRMCGGPAWGVAGERQGLNLRPDKGYYGTLYRAIRHDTPPPPGPVHLATDMTLGALEIHLPPPGPDVVATPHLSAARVQRLEAEAAVVQDRRQAGDLPGARAHAADLTRRFPRVSFTHTLLGEICADMRDAAAAIYEARQSVALRPDWEKLATLGIYLKVFGHDRSALVVLDHCWVNRHLAPGRDQVRDVLRFYYPLVNHEYAPHVLQGVARQAVEYDPEHELSHYRLAQGLFNNGDYNQARTVVDGLAGRLPPDDPMVPAVTELAALAGAKVSRPGS